MQENKSAMINLLIKNENYISNLNEYRIDTTKDLTNLDMFLTFPAECMALPIEMINFSPEMTIAARMLYEMDSYGHLNTGEHLISLGKHTDENNNETFIAVLLVYLKPNEDDTPKVETEEKENKNEEDLDNKAKACLLTLSSNLGKMLEDLSIVLKTYSVLPKSNLEFFEDEDDENEDDEMFDEFEDDEDDNEEDNEED